MAGRKVSSLVTSGWVKENIGNIKLIDATFWLPTQNRNALEEFSVKRIPTAGFLDLDAVRDDAADPLPHMLPTKPIFETAMNTLGICNDDHVVIYECSDFGVHSSPRLWFTFLMYGHPKVSVLQGGMMKYHKIDGYELETSPIDITGSPSVVRGTWGVTNEQQQRPYEAQERDDTLVWNKSMIEEWLKDRDNGATKPQILDARSEGRFQGTAPEPRDVRSGHIENSINLPFTELLTKDGCLLEVEDLKAKFAERNVDLSKPIVTSCGSGISACVLSLAAHECGSPLPSLYDGSWAEWGASHGTGVPGIAA